MVHMEQSKVEVQFDDVVDILPGKEDFRIRVRVVHLWKVPAFLNPSESSSLEMVLVVEKVGPQVKDFKVGDKVIAKLTHQNDIDLIGKIEGLIKKNIEKIEYKETEVLSLMQKVFSAKNVAQSKMMDDGFDEKANEWKKQKLKMLAEKGLLKEIIHQVGYTRLAVLKQKVDCK
ncbi:DEAD-box ATP-dependent RNA helicase [Trifolium repens]|nr:DEAD-box ATP-dependent RNA helicase [Trifolium repens]